MICRTYLCSLRPPIYCKPSRAPLQDRMEVIRIAGYTEPEKLNIAKRFLVNKEMEANGLKNEKYQFFRRRTANRCPAIHAGKRELGILNGRSHLFAEKSAREIVTDGYKYQIKINSKAVEKYLVSQNSGTVKQRVRTRSD